MAINTAIAPALQAVANISFDGSATSTLQYAAALSGLDAAQQKVVMSASGLSAAEQAQVVDMMKVISVTKQYTVAELEKALGMEAGTLASELNVSATAIVTEELLRAAIANGTLSAEQLKAVVSTNAQTGAMIAQAVAAKTLGAAMKSATAAMMTNPLGWITLAIGLIPLLISGISKLIVTQEEEYQEAEKLRSKYEETERELESLEKDLKTNKDRISELQAQARNGTITLIEQEELDRLQRTNAELETTIARKKEIAAMDAEETNKGFAKAFGKEKFTSIDQDRLIMEMETLYEQYGDLITRYENATSVYGEGLADWTDEEIEKASEITNRLFEISNIINAQYDQSTGRWLNESVDFETHVKELVALYNELNDLQESGVTLSSAQKDMLADTRAELVELADTLEDKYLGQYVGEDENTELWQGLLDSINRTIYAAEYFNEKLAEIPESCHDTLVSLGEASELTADKVNELAQQFPQLKAWMDKSGYSAEDVAANFNALGRDAEDSAGRLQGLMAALLDTRKQLEQLEKNGGNVDLFNRKKIDITSSNIDTVKGWGMDAEIGDYMTVAGQTYRNGTGNAAIVVTPILPNGELLTQDELDSYIDDLIFKTIDGNYAANDKYGIVLGVFDDEDSWDKNLAKADEFAEVVHNLNADVVELAENISGLADNPADAVAALREVNEALEAQAAEYQDLYILYADNWALKAWTDTTAQIARNNAAIEDYLSLVNDAGNVDISSPWKDVFYWFDGYTSIMQQLAEIQAEVADGFVISAAKAREFAAVYPEILENATVAANGEIQLDADVVNTFLQGKRAELDAQIESQIAQLEADKAVLEAKKEAAQAQLDIAQNIGEGEGEIANELAEYRINAGNAVAQAMIDAGIDEATAFKLAAAAMAQNAEEFDRVAMEVCTDVNGNFNSAAFDLAQTMYRNLTNVKADLASVAQQAHQTAQAIAGIADGTVKGSEGVVGGSGGGVGGSGIQLNLQSGSFNGTEYTYEAKTSSLEDFTAQLELDLSKYSEAIATIDSQIAMLRALKNAPIEGFNPSGTGNGSKSGGSGSRTKEIEEYIATIEDYRKALKRLAEAREAVAEVEQKISDSDNLKEQIILQRELINAYAEEQAALHNLNEQRRTTINAGANALRELGFEVEYNADTNKLWIENLEHVNELAADSKGEYDTLTEATNALRKETEDLINSLTDLNDANKDGSEEWWELRSSILEAREQIQTLLKDIVQQASKAVDSMQNVYDTLHSAADEYADTGYVTIDTLQKIIDLGVEYVSYLRDEDGQLVINEERVRAVVAAKTEELAIESSMSYVTALRIAQENEDVATLNRLLYATEQATDATWGLVYANLQLLNLSDDQYNAALGNINAIRAIAENAIQGIGKVGTSVKDELESMKDGLDDILKYVMDMLKQRINDQIDALEDMKDAYSDIIDMKKEFLEKDKEAADRQKTMASKMKEIAKLQAKIDAVSLAADQGDRKAMAERTSLMEEMEKLQEDLADTQADYTMDAQKDALDEMEDAYHAEKDKEIKILEDSISSYQKLYDMAIAYIEDHWDTLYSELIDWNTEYGNDLNSDITTAWDNALAAAQRYGSYVSALNSIDADITAAGTSGQNLQVGNTYYSDKVDNSDMVSAIVSRMKGYAGQWRSTNTKALNDSLHEKAALEAAQLDRYGVHADFRSDGSWIITKDENDPSKVGKNLYQVYHSGTAGVGGVSTLKQDEVFAKLQKGEMVLTQEMTDSLSTQIERMGLLQKAFTDMPDYVSKSALASILKLDGAGTVNNVTNNNSNQPIKIEIGETKIYGADDSTVQQHITVTRDMVNQIARMLRIGM